MRKILLSIMLLFSVVFINISFADGSDSDIEKLNAEIMELRQQMVEMQKKHDAEIEALKQQIDEIAGGAAKKEAEDELAVLRQLAQAEAAKEKPKEEKAEDVTFKSRGLSLQALNPEISVTGDFLFSARQDSTSE